MVGEQGSFADGLGPTEEQRVEKKQEAGRCQTDGTFNGVGGRGVWQNQIFISERTLQLPFGEVGKDLQESIWRNQLSVYCNSLRENMAGIHMVAVPNRELMSRAILKVKQQYMVKNVKGEKEGEDEVAS